MLESAVNAMGDTTTTSRPTEAALNGASVDGGVQARPVRCSAFHSPTAIVYCEPQHRCWMCILLQAASSAAAPHRQRHRAAPLCALCRQGMDAAFGDAAADIPPAVPTVDPSLRLRVLQTLGVAYVRAERHEPALRCIQAMRAAAPEGAPPPPSCALLAVSALCGLRRFEEAEDELSAAVAGAVDRDDASAAAKAVHYLLEAKRGEAAAAALCALLEAHADRGDLSGAAYSLNALYGSRARGARSIFLGFPAVLMILVWSFHVPHLSAPDFCCLLSSVVCHRTSAAALFVERVSTDPVSLADGLLRALASPAFVATLAIHTEPRPGCAAVEDVDIQRKRLRYCHGLLWNVATELFDSKRFDAARRVFSALGSDLSEPGDLIRARAARANALCCMHGGDIEGASSFVELAGTRRTRRGLLRRGLLRPRHIQRQPTMSRGVFPAAAAQHGEMSCVCHCSLCPQIRLRTPQRRNPAPPSSFASRSEPVQQRRDWGLVSISDDA